MPSRVPVLHYLGLADHQHVLDELVRAERRSCETPFSADPNALGDLFEPAGISPDDWKSYVLERFGLDLAAPDETAFKALYPGYTEGFLAGEFRRMTENAEYWSMSKEDQATHMWEVEEGTPALAYPVQMWEILENSGGKGLPFVCFMATPDEIRSAFSADNEITLFSRQADDPAILFGLHDPANGAGHCVFAAGTITIRPSVKGRTLVNDAEVLDLFGLDGGRFATVAIVAKEGEPLLASSRSTETYRPSAPRIDFSTLPPVSPSP